jgi:hypothetical protein
MIAVRRYRCVTFWNYNRPLNVDVDMEGNPIARTRQLLRKLETAYNVIVGEADQYGKRIRILARLLRFRSTTCYNYTIALAFGYILLDTFLFLLLDFGNYSFCRSPLF